MCLLACVAVVCAGNVMSKERDIVYNTSVVGVFYESLVIALSSLAGSLETL